MLSPSLGIAGRARVGLAIGLGIVVLLAARVQAADTVPAELLQSFRKVAALRAQFREEKRMALLAAPLTRTGTLYYEAPGRLAQHVATPAPSRLLIDGKRLETLDASGRSSVDLAQHPAVGALLGLILNLLGGDGSALGREATIQFVTSPKDRRWTLELLPKTDLLRKLLRKMTCVGRGTTLETLTVLDASGDETVTRFSKVEFLPRFPPEERTRAFSRGP